MFSTGFSQYAPSSWFRNTQAARKRQIIHRLEHLPYGQKNHHPKFIPSTERKKMPFWLFISINWIVHRIGWSEPSEALKVTLSGNLPEVQTSSSASQEIATSHQKLLCNSASIISECLPSALQLAKGRGTKAQKSTGTHGSWQHLAWLQRAMLSRICVISADGWMPF